MGFFASIGNTGFPVNGGDLWEVKGGKGGGLGPKFRNWARAPEDTFHRTRRESRDLFVTLYESAANIDFSHENEYGYPNVATSVRDLIRPRVNFEDGLRWWQRGRRIHRRPYDMDGNKCD